MNEKNDTGRLSNTENPRHENFHPPVTAASDTSSFGNEPPVQASPDIPEDMPPAGFQVQTSPGKYPAFTAAAPASPEEVPSSSGVPADIPPSGFQINAAPAVSQPTSPPREYAPPQSDPVSQRAFSSTPYPPPYPPSPYAPPPYLSPPYNPPQGGHTTPYGAPPQYSPVRNTYLRKDHAGILAEAKKPSGFAAVLLCYFFSVLFSEMIFRGGLGISVPVLTLLFYALFASMMRRKPEPPPLSASLLLIPIGLIALSFMLIDSPFVKFINVLMLMALIPVQLTKMSGSSPAGVFSPAMFLDAIYCVIGRPFYFLDTPFSALSGGFGKKSGKSGKTGKILLGLLIALPVVIIFIALFVGADDVFRYVLDFIIRNLKISLSGLFIDLLVGVLLAIYFSALLITFAGSSQRAKREIKQRKGIDNTVVSAFLATVCTVHIAFVAVQFAYLFGARDSLPGGISYANDARRGFFELLAALAISTLIAILVTVFARKNEAGKLTKPTSFFLTIMILCNYVIFISAFYRMSLYVGRYGLTVLRVSVLWFMALLAAALLGIIIKAWLPGFKALRFASVCIIVMVIGLNAVNLNGLIAKYNVDRYIASGYEWDLDVPYLSRLGHSASSQTARLIELDTPVKSEAAFALRYQAQSLAKKSWRDFALVDLSARSVYRQYGISSTPDGNIYDDEGYDINGLDKSGYDRDGYDRYGYDRYGYDREGYDYSGFDKNGYDRDGYDHYGYDRDGYDRYGNYDEYYEDNYGYETY